MEKIAIVGTGTMGSAIGDLLHEDYEVTGIGKDDALGQIATADTVILAVKPQTFLPNEGKQELGLANELWHYITDKQYVISVMAGITTEQVCRLLDTSHVVRTMPNTANSLIAWYTEDKTADEEELKTLFGHWVTSIRLDHEKQFDIFTATAGSGPAFLLLMAKVMEQELAHHGFGSEQARKIAGHTLQGAADLAKSGVSFDDLIGRVASKGGTTEAGLKDFKANNFGGIVRGAIQAARSRSEELGR